MQITSTIPSLKIIPHGGFFGDDADGSDIGRPFIGKALFILVAAAATRVTDEYVGGCSPCRWWLMKSKKGTLMQIQSDTISAAKAAFNPVRTNIMPQKQKKKPVSYDQLARSIHELAAASDQKSSQRQLVYHVFSKLAVYNSVDPSLAPSLLLLEQRCEDRTVLRYVYYYLARILWDTGSQGLSPGGGILTPNWDALADMMLLEG